MYYFDNEYLKQYIDTGMKLKVYVDQDWLAITNMKDLKNSNKGTGYDEYGKASYFDYRNIQAIKAGTNVIDLEMLQKTMASEDEPEPNSQEEPEQKPEPKEEPMSPDREPTPLEEPEEEPEEEAPQGKGKPTKQPQKTHYDPYMVGRMLLNEHANRKLQRGNRVKIIAEQYNGFIGTVKKIGKYNVTVKIDGNFKYYHQREHNFSPSQLEKI